MPRVHELARNPQARARRGVDRVGVEIGRFEREIERANALASRREALRAREWERFLSRLRRPFSPGANVPPLQNLSPATGLGSGAGPLPPSSDFAPATTRPPGFVGPIATDPAASPARPPRLVVPSAATQNAATTTTASGPAMVHIAGGGGKSLPPLKPGVIMDYGSGGSYIISTGKYFYPVEGGLANTSAESSLSPVSTPISFTEGASSTVNVQDFTDSNPNAVASEYSATIDWGDHSSSNGTITGSNGQFHVTGTHDYAEEGSYYVNVKVYDEGTSYSENATLTAYVNDAALSATPQDLSPTEGVALTNQAVATFTDADPYGTASDYSATVDWGDGNTSTGTVAGSNGSYTVTDAHYYDTAGNYPVTVTITDGAGNPLTESSSAVMTDAALSASAATITGTQNAPIVDATVATFTDPNPNDGPQEDQGISSYSVSVNWGDNSAPDTNPAINGSAGSFSILDNHTYTTSGTFTVTTTIQDDGGSTVTQTSTATIAATTMIATPATLTASEDTSFSNQTVATFTDSITNRPASSYSANITWGDGSSSTGTVAGSNGSFTVTGSHDYSEGGSLPVGVTITDASNTQVVAASTANVSDPALSPTGGFTINANAGVSTGNVTVATFTGAGPGETASDYMAFIDWGDNSGVEQGSISQNGSTFTVTGDNTYADAGTYPITVTIADGNVNSYTASSTANVAPSPLVASDSSLSLVEGNAANNVVVATVTDPGMSQGGLSATIDWGDGSTPINGTIVANGSSFNVVGSYTYADPAAYTITVTVTDSAGNTDTALSSAVVADGTLTPGPLTIPMTEQSTFSGTVATFTDQNPADTTADYLATITWGDGQSDPGTITGGNGSFAVTGSHTYADEGSDPVAVAISDLDGGSSVTANSTAAVADAALGSTPATLNATVGIPMTNVTVAQFTDPNPADPASNFTATITWGDNSQSSGIVTGADGVFSVQGAHTYNAPGTLGVSVTIDDKGGSQTIPAGTATVVPQLTYTLATFADSDQDSNPADFTATITWGAGSPSTSTGTIALVSGQGLTVFGQHIFPEDGTVPVTITISDKVDGAQGGVTSQAFVQNAAMAFSMPAPQPQKATTPAKVSTNVELKFQNLKDGGKLKNSGDTDEKNPFQFLSTMILMKSNLIIRV
jgi:hypothetical protein